MTSSGLIPAFSRTFSLTLPGRAPYSPFRTARDSLVVAQRLKDTGSLDPKVLNVDTNTLLYQVPGGMRSPMMTFITAWVPTI